MGVECCSSSEGCLGCGRDGGRCWVVMLLLLLLRGPGRQAPRPTPTLRPRPIPPAGRGHKERHPLQLHHRGQPVGPDRRAAAGHHAPGEQHPTGTGLVWPSGGRAVACRRQRLGHPVSLVTWLPTRTYTAGAPPCVDLRPHRAWLQQRGQDCVRKREVRAGLMALLSCTVPQRAVACGNSGVFDSSIISIAGGGEGEHAVGVLTARRAR